MDSKSLLEAQAKIDEEIRTLEQRLKALRVSRNALAPINQLAIEVLTEVFLWHQAGYTEGKLCKFVEWIKVAHISKHWRSVAFGAKALWATIPTHNSEYADFALQLSSPIPINLSGSQRVDRANPNFLRSLLQRAGTVKCERSIGSIIASELQRAPQNFTGIQEMDFHQAIFSAGTSPFPRSLKRLSLDWTYFIWSWINRSLHHITDLCILHARNRITVEAFVGHMSQLPNLSTLRISGVFVTEADEPVVQDEVHNQDDVRITLRSLDIQDQAVPSTEFLSHVILQEHFTLTAELKGQAPDMGQELIATIDHYLRGCQHTIRGVELNFRGPDVNLVVSRSERGTLFPILKLQAEIGVDVMAAWVDETPVLQIEQLHKFSTNVFSSVSQWQSYRFTELQELVVGNRNSSVAFLRYWAAETDLAFQSNDWNGVALPVLKSITLGDMQFVGDLEDRVRTAFQKRAEHGCKVEKLVLNSAHILMKEEERLRRVVDEVVVSTRSPFDLLNIF